MSVASARLAPACLGNVLIREEQAAALEVMSRFAANPKRLRPRRLGGKRALALREFALGMEGLQRFVDREPLRRVHECAFGVLALESEPVDPRL